MRRQMGAGGEAWQTPSMMVSVSIHLAIREQLRRDGLPLPVVVILGNDHEAPEFTAPVAAKAEYLAESCDIYRLQAEAPVYSEPQAWSNDNRNTLIDPRQIAMAALLDGPPVTEYRDLDTRPTAKLVAPKVRMLFIKEFAEKPDDPATSDSGGPFDFGFGITPEKAERTAEFVIRNVFKTDPKYMEKPAVREAIRLIGDMFRK